MKIDDIQQNLEDVKDLLEKSLSSDEILVVSENGQWQLQKARKITDQDVKALKAQYFGKLKSDKQKIDSIKADYHKEQNNPEKDPMKVNQKIAAQTMGKDEDNTLDYSKINSIKPKEPARTLNYKEFNKPTKDTPSKTKLVYNKPKKVPRKDLIKPKHADEDVEIT